MYGPPGQAGAASHHGLYNRPGLGESSGIPPRPGRAVGYLPGAPGGPSAPVRAARNTFTGYSDNYSISARLSDARVPLLSWHKSGRAHTLTITSPGRDSSTYHVVEHRRVDVGHEPAGDDDDESLHEVDNLRGFQPLAVAPLSPQPAHKQRPNNTLQNNICIGMA